VFSETFDTLEGWRSAPDSPPGAAFQVRDGVLQVRSYGGGAFPTGPRIVHRLPRPIRADSVAFSLEVVLHTSQGGRSGRATVRLLGEDGTPRITLTWDPIGRLTASVEGVEDAVFRNDLRHPFSGKLALRHSGGRSTVHLNDGPALLAVVEPVKGLLQYVKIEVVRTNEFDEPPDVKIDLLRIRRVSEPASATLGRAWPLESSSDPAPLLRRWARTHTMRRASSLSGELRRAPRIRERPGPATKYLQLTADIQDREEDR